jgi:biopolymer transport protein ExbD
VKLARRDPRKARIEIIPMIDTVYFLLVFFMMTSLAMATYRGMPVNLPRAQSGQATRDDSAAITLAKDGGTFLNREPITPAALGERLRGLVAGNPNLVVMIHADGEVQHHRVVQVVDVARTAGVARIAIAVAPGDTAHRP